MQYFEAHLTTTVASVHIVKHEAHYIKDRYILRSYVCTNLFHFETIKFIISKFLLLLVCYFLKNYIKYILFSKCYDLLKWKYLNVQSLLKCTINCLSNSIILLDF